MNIDEYYDNLELYHHGIRGQRWGVRRYQNEDGSYTSAGARRYANTSSILKSANDTANAASEAIDSSNTVLKIVRKQNKKEAASKSKQEYNKKIEAKRAQDKKNLSTLSDAELRRAIKRLEMEKKYSSLTDPESGNANTQKTGMDKVINFLTVAGAATAAVGGAIGVANSGMDLYSKIRG